MRSIARFALPSVSDIVTNTVLSTRSRLSRSSGPVGRRAPAVVRNNNCGRLAIVTASAKCGRTHARLTTTVARTLIECTEQQRKTTTTSNSRPSVLDDLAVKSVEQTTCTKRPNREINQMKAKENPLKSRLLECTYSVHYYRSVT